MDIEKVHYVSVTGIIKKGNKYLICKRSSKEKNFPGKWCVPGGKIEHSDFIDNKKDTGKRNKRRNKPENKQYRLCLQSGFLKAKWFFNNSSQLICRIQRR